MNDEQKDLRELQKLLSRLPDAPVASNFTARVMAAIEREETRLARRRVFAWNLWNWHKLLPRVAVTASVLVLGVVGFQRYEMVSQRNLLAKNVAQIAAAQPAPSVDALNNFDAIQRLSQPVAADKELLALLQ